MARNTGRLAAARRSSSRNELRSGGAMRLRLTDPNVLLDQLGRRWVGNGLALASCV